MKKLFLLLSIFIIVNLSSLNLTLKNGSSINGKLILCKKNKFYVINKDGLSIVHNNIINVMTPETKEFDLINSKHKQNINLKSFPRIKSYNSKFINGRILSEIEKIQYIRPNLKLLPLGIGFAVLGYEKFKVARDISKAIKKLEDDNDDTPKSLKNEQKRNLTYGWIFVGISFVDILISFEKVELYSDVTNIGLEYKF